MGAETASIFRKILLLLPILFLMIGMLPQTFFLLSFDGWEMVENLENTAEDEKEQEDVEKDKVLEGVPIFYVHKGFASLTGENLYGKWNSLPADIILPPPEQA